MRVRVTVVRDYVAGGERVVWSLHVLGSFLNVPSVGRNLGLGGPWRLRCKWAEAQKVHLVLWFFLFLVA